MKDSNIAKRSRMPRQWRLLPATWVVAWVVVAAMLGAGCTSDPANPVGAGFIDSQIDSTLVSVELVAMEAFSGIRAENPDVKIHQQQSLFLGTEPDTRTSFLVNFDFSDFLGTEFPEDIYNLENIKTVKFSMTKLTVYALDIEDPEEKADLDTPQELKFWINEIAEPFDPVDYESFPTVAPTPIGPFLTKDVDVPVTGSEPTLAMFPEDLMKWITAGTKVGMIVRLSDDTPEGLVGFASRDLIQFSQVPLLAQGTIVAPEIIVEFNDATLIRQIVPSEDTTVFEAVSPAPETIDEAADTFVLRTGLRSYPAFRFDMSVLPDNALINRAVLTVVNDTASSFGPVFSVAISEITAELMDNPYGTPPSGDMNVALMGDDSRVYPLTFRSNLLTKLDYTIEFDITTGVRRAVNLVNEEPRGFILSGIDDASVFPFLSRPPDVTTPDFYYRQMNFFGFEDPDKAPKLKIWYSVIDDLSGGGQ